MRVDSVSRTCAWRPGPIPAGTRDRRGRRGRSRRGAGSPFAAPPPKPPASMLEQRSVAAALDDAGADRLPHAYRPCRRKGPPSSRCASPARTTRRSPRRRRHRLDGSRHARGQRGRTSGGRAAAASRRADRRRRHDGGGEVGATGSKLATEARQLRAARRLGGSPPRRHHQDLPRAHALPPEGAGRQGRLHRHGLRRDAAPHRRRKGLADAVDAFCEGIGFSPEQTGRVFATARKLGLPVKLHGDQLSTCTARRWRRGTRVCRSIMPSTPTRREAAAHGGGRNHRRDAAGRVLLHQGDAEAACGPLLAACMAVAMALATDNNPGSSPLTSIAADAQHGARRFSA